MNLVRTALELARLRRLRVAARLMRAAAETEMALQVLRTDMRMAQANGLMLVLLPRLTIIDARNHVGQAQQQINEGSGEAPELLLNVEGLEMTSSDLQLRRVSDQLTALLSPSAGDDPVVTTDTFFRRMLASLEASRSFLTILAGSYRS